MKSQLNFIFSPERNLYNSTSFAISPYQTGRKNSGQYVISHPSRLFQVQDLRGTDCNSKCMGCRIHALRSSPYKCAGDRKRTVGSNICNGRMHGNGSQTYAKDTIRRFFTSSQTRRKVNRVRRANTNRQQMSPSIEGRAVQHSFPRVRSENGERRTPPDISMREDDMWSRQ